MSDFDKLTGLLKSFGFKQNNIFIKGKSIVSEEYTVLEEKEVGVPVKVICFGNKIYFTFTSEGKYLHYGEVE